MVTGNDHPTLQLSNGLSKTISPLVGVALIVGDDTGAGTFSGNLSIDSGADLVASGTSQDINIANNLGTNGTITVTGPGSRLRGQRARRRHPRRIQRATRRWT